MEIVIMEQFGSELNFSLVGAELSIMSERPIVSVTTPNDSQQSSTPMTFNIGTVTDGIIEIEAFRGTLRTDYIVIKNG